MSFGTMAVWQALALVGVAGVAAWMLFRIKVRPPRVQVPTLLLWRKVFDHRREMTWWERVRRAVSLALLRRLLGIATQPVQIQTRYREAGIGTGEIGRASCRERV